MKKIYLLLLTFVLSISAFGDSVVLPYQLRYSNEMCVDYLDLNNAKCYVNSTSPINTLTFDDFIEVSPVDYGSSQVKSRHTIHTDNETDVRTGDVAYTIPDGELASVRLGNWEAGYAEEAERIEFSFSVDTNDYHILLLKYLPILENPFHDNPEDPRFKMDIFVDGEVLDTCVQADFFNRDDVLDGQSLKANAAAQGWHIEHLSGTSTVVWKEWTTVGINLNKPEYQEKTLKVRLTTFDCTFSAHFGYAYFTLGCADGRLSVTKNSSNDNVYKAPDGFVYNWYRVEDQIQRNDKNVIPQNFVLGHEQTFVVSADDEETYAVDCMFIQDSTNYFTLLTSDLKELDTRSVVDNITANSAQIQWIPDSAVTEYTISVYTSDTLYRQYHVDGEGKLINQQNALWHISQIKKDTTYASEDYYVLTISDLSSGTDYDYTIVGMDDQKVPVYIEEGSFRTESTEGFFDAIITETDKPRKTLRNGQILILRGDKTYTITGTETR